MVSYSDLIINPKRNYNTRSKLIFSFLWDKRSSNIYHRIADKYR